LPFIPCFHSCLEAGAFWRFLGKDHPGQGWESQGKQDLYQKIQEVLHKEKRREEGHRQVIGQAMPTARAAAHRQ
jgi:hypothetical protein